MNGKSVKSPPAIWIDLPEVSRHAATRSCSDAIGIRLSVPPSRSHRRRLKLSTTQTSWPRFERYIACGHPKYPSPPVTITRIENPPKVNGDPPLYLFLIRAIRSSAPGG